MHDLETAALNDLMVLTESTHRLYHPLLERPTDLKWRVFIDNSRIRDRDITTYWY
tara:strand:- start:17 stop:181 length:165 start_codon:yes stop_codon:yes gene_type:complete